MLLWTVGKDPGGSPARKDPLEPEAQQGPGVTMLPVAFSSHWGGLRTRVASRIVGFRRLKDVNTGEGRT